MNKKIAANMVYELCIVACAPCPARSPVVSIKKMINKLLLLVVFLSSFSQMFGECLGGYIDIWPRKHETHSESVFLLEGNGIGDIMRDINKKYNAVLKSKEHIVYLEVIQTLMGAGDDVQVMLKPVEILKEGANYELILEGLDVKSSRVCPLPLSCNSSKVEILI